MFAWYGFQLSFKPFVTMLVAPLITDIIVHFMFHIHHVSVHKFLYFIFLLFLSLDILSAGTAAVVV
jgi:hypothetical protein